MRGRGRRLRAAAIASAAAVSVIVVFVGLLVVAEAVPDDAVVAGLEDAIEQGHYGPSQYPDGMGGAHTGYTDCVILGVGLGEPREPLGLVRRALYAPRLGACDAGAEQIHTLAAGGEKTSGPYYRYWNGHTVLTRPAVATVGVTGLRAVVAGLGFAALLFAVVTLGRRVGWWTSAALFLPLLVGTNAAVTPFGSVAHAIALTAAAAGTGAIVLAAGRWGRWGAVAAAMLGAALFVYVDQLTTPVVPWALAAFVAGAVQHARRAGLREVTTTVVAVGAAWPIAYAATWGSRWLVAALALRSNVVARILDQTRFRLSGEHPRVQEQFGAALDTNWTWWLDHLVTARFVVAAVAVVAGVAVVVVLCRRGWRGLLPTAVLAAPALLAPAWYELLSNHSQIHRHFTYRSLVAALGVGVAACVLTARRAADP